MIDVSFNGFNLATIDGVVVEAIPDLHESPGKSVNYTTLARRDGSVIINSQFTNKKFTIKGIVRMPTKAQMAASVTALTRLTVPLEGALDLDFGDGDPIRYLGTLENLETPKVAGGYCEWTMNFTCSTPFGEARQTLDIFFNGITTAHFQNDVNFAGAYAALPRFEVTLVAASGTANGSITLKNGSTGQGITVHDNFTIGDKIVVDNKAMTVMVNGELVDFEGVFFDVDPEVTTLTYDDNFTTRTANLKVSYAPRY